MRYQRGGQRGFTLVELLVVISILILLLSLLMPAILKARQTVLVVLVRGQIKKISDGASTYKTIFNFAPGVVTDPPSPAPYSSPSKISGAQNLRASLTGSENNSNALEREYRGPAVDNSKYGDSDVQLHDVYSFTKKELMDHSAVPNAGTSGYSGAWEVYADYRLKPPQAILYYRKHRFYEVGSEYQEEDNSVYYTSETKGTNDFSNFWSSKRRKAAPGFILVSAGADRIYFTSDDLTNVAIKDD
jgi:prepilin-type N-terminal cleavage/methylation domain-containing protein